MNLLPLPPCGSETHSGEDCEEESGDLQHQDSSGSRSRLTYTLRGGDSAPYSIVAVAESPEHAAHGLGSLKISDLPHGVDSNNEAEGNVAKTWDTIGRMKTTRQPTAIIEREDDAYVALCPELDIASQGETVEAARTNLVEALEPFFESADPTEITRRLHTEIFVTRVEVPVG